MSVEDSDIASGLIQDKLPVHISPPSAEFLPWHKVRKHFIRRHQWDELTRRHVKDTWRVELQKPSSTVTQGASTMLITNPLRCLVIPGNHLLDMRSMWGEVNPLGCSIRYLGFNEGQGSTEIGTEVHVANNSVTSLDGVVKDSQVVRDRFEAIVGNSMAFKNLRQYGPYHVVNLDLCGSMFPNTETDATPYFTALDRLLQYQFESQKTSWLLFLTTVVKPSAVDKERMQTLCKPIGENFSAHADFLDRLKVLCPAAIPADVKSGCVNICGLPDDALIRLFGVALGKWLIKMGQIASPKWTVAMRRSYQYSISVNNGSVMLSLAFELTPNFSPPVDATGMSKLQVNSKQFMSELECALKLTDSVANIADVDKRLADDAEMKAGLIAEAADLMASAGFDRGAYIKWVADGELTAPG